MPCYRIPGVGMAHIKMTNTKKRPAPAPCCARMPHPSNEGGKPEVRCMAISTILCDWPVEGGTCDAPLCAEHAQAIGPDRHLCPRHAKQLRAAEPDADGHCKRCGLEFEDPALLTHECPPGFAAESAPELLG